MTEVSYELNLSPDLPSAIQSVALERGEAHEEEDRLKVIDEFRNYIKQNDCTPHRLDDAFLIKFLRCRSWKIPNAYKLLCNYYRFREENLEYYEKVRPLDYLHVGDAKIIEITPYRDQNGHRMIIYRFGNWRPNEISVDELFLVSVILMELGSLEPIGQVVGGVGIFDLKDLSISQVMHLSPTVIQKLLALLVTSMPIRTSAIHVINTNWCFKMAFNLVKPFLSSMMRERLFIHSNVSSLHEHIHPDHLPKRYGGVQEESSSNIWFETLSRNETLQNELRQLGYVF